MKRFIIFTLLLLAMQVSYAQKGQYKVTSESGVQARTEPSTSKGYVATTIKCGELIRVSDIEDGWATTRYKTSTLYVDSSRITLYKTFEQLREEKERAEAEKRARWWDPMNWGIIGWILRWFIVPIVVFSYIMSIPFKMLAKQRFINNFFFISICYILMVIMIFTAIYLLGKFEVYSGSGEAFVLFALGFTLGKGDIQTISNNRCPNCRYSDFSIIDSYVTRIITTTTTRYSNGTTKEKKHTDTTLNYHQKCDVCGYEWWVNE